MKNSKNILIVFVLSVFVGAAAFWISSKANAAKTTGAQYAMYGIRAILMHPAKFDGNNAGKACDVDAQVVYDRFVNIFKKAGLPIITDLQQYQRKANIAALHFNILLVTNQDANMECHTMIMANAKDRANLAVPPVPQTRDVQLLYWDSMMRTLTIQPIHRDKVFEMIDQMANSFVAQYKEANEE